MIWTRSRFSRDCDTEVDRDALYFHGSIVGFLLAAGFISGAYATQIECTGKSEQGWTNGSSFRATIAGPNQISEAQWVDQDGTKTSDKAVTADAKYKPTKYKEYDRYNLTIVPPVVPGEGIVLLPKKLDSLPASFKQFCSLAAATVDKRLCYTAVPNKTGFETALDLGAPDSWRALFGQII